MTPRNLICFKCKHFNELKGGCEAFGQDIPEEVIESNKHDKVYPEQVKPLTFEEI